MNYLTRPVFTFLPNWAKARGKKLTIDLRRVELGMSEPFFAGVELHAAQGYSFSLTLRGSAEIDAVDAFTAALAGSVSGFWFPALFEAFKVTAGVSATQFKIAEQGLEAALAAEPDLYLWFVRSSANDGRPAKILSVVSGGDGTETVTLTAPQDVIVTAADMCCRLNYVRLAGDDESGEFVAEGLQTRAFKVVELPLEYAAFETGEQPIWLYTVSCATPVLQTWRFTSYPADVHSSGSTFARFSMDHGTMKRSAKLDEEVVEVSAKRDPSHPFSLFLPLPPSRPARVKIERATLADPDARTVEFNGFVRWVADEGENLKATCESWASVLKQNVAAMQFQKFCNWHVFDDRTCKAARWKHEVPGRVHSVDNDARPPAVVVTLDYPAKPKAADWLSDGWFSGGMVDFNWGARYEGRGVVSSGDDGAGRVLLRVIAPTLAEVGDQVVMVSGCDGQFQTCKGKFQNEPNYGGFPFVPEQNLSLKAMDDVVSQGGKK